MHQPRAARAAAGPVDVIVVCAYGLLSRRRSLERALWLNVHPSLLPRWRGAAPVERAILAGDETTGVTIHETVAALDAGPIAAQEAFPIGAVDDAGAVFARSAEVAARLLERGAAGAAVHAAARGRRDLRGEDRRRPTASSTSTTRVDAWRRVRALSPHIGAWTTSRVAGVTIWRARLEDGALRSGGGAARGASPDELRRVPAAALRRDRAGAARRVRGRAARLRGRRVRRPRAGLGGRGARRARPRAGAADRLRHGAAARARSTTASTCSAAGRCASSTRAVRAALRIAGYELGWSDAPAHAVADDAVELVRAAGLERATGFTNAVARRLAEGFRALVDELPEGPLKHSYPDWIYETWVRDWGVDEALALMRAQNEPGELVVRSAEPVGEPTDVPGAYRVSTASTRPRSPRAGSGRRAAARSSRRSSSARVTASASSTRARRRAARRRCCAGRSPPSSCTPGRARELEANARRLGATNVRVVNADVRELAERGFDRALVDAPCSGLGVLGRRPDLRWRARAAARAPAASCSAPRPSGRSPAAPSSTRSAR